VSKAFASNAEHAQRLYEYSSKHWLSYSTPILSYGRSKRGMPISCFLNYIEDTAEGLVQNFSETAWLSMLGGGVGIGFGIRAADDKSTGVMPHLKTYDASSLAYRQGKTRRGSYAAYLDISHPDIMMFLEMRKPTGDQNMRALNLHHGINISDRFMEVVERCMQDPDADDGWNLIEPHSGAIRETVSAKALWQKILELRMETGEPYIHYIDTSNRLLPDFQKELGLKVHQSNLCSEIILPTNEERTAVCCLSSVNLENYDAWSKDPMFLKDMAEMLDNVLQFFIDNAPDTVSRAKFSAARERSIGIGALGFHAYLQKKGIAWESAVAKGANMRMFRLIRSKLDEANIQLGKERGEAPDAAGTGKRFSHVMAIAPNASSSIIMGNTSPSIEPFRANAYRQDTLSGAFLNKNKYLDALIQKKCEENKKLDSDEVWSSIIANDGSVQHLTFLSEIEKDIYKTSMEIDQRWVIEHAADRQAFVDQAQSLNLFFRPDVNIKYLHAIHYLAWKQGLKTLYYCRSEKLGKADKVSKRIERQVINEIDMSALVNDEECIACEG
jgi:ribonucleoside-diphosphate reductase alpha chain